MTTNAYALLGLLSIQPMTGYEMKKWVDHSLSHFWKTSYGQIYPTMTKFVKEGLVTVEPVTSDTGPERKLYTLTDKGMATLKAWLAQDTEDFNAKDETLLKFFFSDMLSIDEVIDKLEKSIDYNQGVAARYNGDVDEMKAVKRPTRHQLNIYLCTKKGVYLNEARVKWAKECIEALKWFKSLDET